MNNIFEYIQIIQPKLLEKVSLDFKRYIYNQINWSSPLIWIFGERWIWKTYLILQRLKETQNWVYILWDWPMVQEKWLFEIVFFLNKEYEIKQFYIDEIHKLNNWPQHIKSIYDSFPDVKVVFSGSNSLDLFHWTVDLGRRWFFYKMFWLNFYEFLKFNNTDIIWPFSFKQIITQHKKITSSLAPKIKLTQFKYYLKQGYYPFGINKDFAEFVLQVTNTLEKLLLEDLPVFHIFKTASLQKLSKLFYFLANIPPSDLTIHSLAKKLNLDHSFLENVLYILDKIWVVHLIPKYWNISDRIRKQYKILLGNPNIYFAYNLNPDIWALRESFFANMIKRIPNVQIYAGKQQDFMIIVDEKQYKFELWGKSKPRSKYNPDTFIVKDDILISQENILPLYLLGFLNN